jgi:ketosteroid isomerase-like protein
MAAVDDLEQVIEQYHLAGNEFAKGNPEPVQKMFSHREDVTLNNPFSPPARGWGQVAQTQERAASNFRELRRHGEVSIETVAKYVTPELAYIVEIERYQAKVDEREDIAPFALRATSIFRPEEGTWKVVHRHADPITEAQPAESVIQQ